MGDSDLCSSRFSSSLPLPTLASTTPSKVRMQARPLAQRCNLLSDDTLVQRTNTTESTADHFKSGRARTEPHITIQKRVGNVTLFSSVSEDKMKNVWDLILALAPNSSQAAESAGMAAKRRRPFLFRILNLHSSGSETGS